MTISKEQFLTLSPEKQMVVDANGCQLIVVDNHVNDPINFSGIPGERRIILQGQGGTLLNFGWDDKRNLIVEEESGEWFTLNHRDAHVVEL